MTSQEMLERWSRLRVRERSAKLLHVLHNAKVKPHVIFKEFKEKKIIRKKVILEKCEEA